MPTPSISVVDASIVGSLEKGKPFYWYNPTGTDVTVADCGTWADPDTYDVPAGGYSTAGTILSVPNSNPYAFTEDPNEWDAPGMPHISAPSMGVAHEKEKEVA
jgi:hypothetical protein